LGRPDGGGAELVAPPSVASVRAYADLPALDAAMAGERGVYGRHGNDSVMALEDALVDLEAADDGGRPLCRVTASGQAALLLAITLLVSPRRRRVAVVRPCYGSTESLIAGPLQRLGVELVTIDLPPAGDVAGQRAVLEGGLDASVGCAVAEVVGNPLMNVLDLDLFTAVCRQRGVASVVDATFTTPLLLQPLGHGADAVLHSLSKSLSGHSDVIGGALLVSAEHEAAASLDAHSRLLGAVLAPGAAWLALRGLRSAPLRVERSSSNAAALVARLGSHGAVRGLHYPGAHSPAEEELAARLLPHGRGAMLGLDLGTREAAGRFLAAAPGIALAPSLGDISTTASHPALTSHRGMSPQQRQVLGIGEGLIRLSVGCEDIGDLEAEVGAALDASLAGEGIGSLP